MYQIRRVHRTSIHIRCRKESECRAGLRLACPLLIFPNPDREKYKNVQFKFDRDNIDVENLNHYTLEEVKPDMIVEHTCQNNPLPSSLSLMAPPVKTRPEYIQIKPKPETFSLADDDGFHVHNWSNRFNFFLLKYSQKRYSSNLIFSVSRNAFPSTSENDSANPWALMQMSGLSLQNGLQQLANRTPPKPKLCPKSYTTKVRSP